MTQAAVNWTSPTRAALPGSGRPAPAPTPVGRLPRRRRWGMVALGMILVVVCAVLAYLLVVTAGITRPYLVVTREVPYGTVIGPDDLTEVEVNPAAGLQPIPASQRDQVIGKHAAADLYPGTLLIAKQFTDLAVPAPGEQVIGIELKPAQVPVRTLTPGDSVVLVVVPAAGLSGVPDPHTTTSTRPVSVAATVAGSVGPDTTGNVRVDVAVAQADGPTVAAMAAAGRIAVVITTRD
ncbi:hypothetical protein Pa4123_61690 [Phytohabitans aurantiacus]|uniref:SAF domain-containing protein n=2 Tax=Phytohabitans aurantiacus TaxID=3016789 RepID=A0ABQ5R2W2_9ACTN|nr:hypothetical protein Pa4123_61690 [Phytohabitans aurantiacus]